MQQRETVLWDETSAPMRLGSGSQLLPILTYPYARLRAKEGLGCLWLRGHCCLAGGLRSLQPTAMFFSFAEKPDLA